MKRWLANSWYQFGWSAEIATGGHLVRTILGHPVLAYRDEDGTLGAVLDMCPHRFAPLSAGRIEGKVVTCGYHGLAFGQDGRCVHNPHGPVTSSMNVRAFPVAERHMAIWLWMGEGEGDPSLIPDLSFIDETPEAARITGYMPTKADYRLIVDNIMDLSHADYLHPDTLGGMMVQAKASSGDDGDGIYAKWHAIDIEPPGTFKASSPPGTNVDIRVEVFWSAPALMQLTTSSVPTGTQPQAHDTSRTLHNMTPATADFTHYFYCSTRQFLVDDPAFSEVLKAALQKAFVEEDKPMLEMQQQRIGASEFWDLSPILLKSDAAAVRVRRELESLIAAEEQTAT